MMRALGESVRTVTWLTAFLNPSRPSLPVARTTSLLEVSVSYARSIL